jgi:CheY-like chemotaxis protein
VENGHPGIRKQAVHLLGIGCRRARITSAAGLILLSNTRLSVFLVEDEAIIRMMIAGMVEELGHEVVAEAGHVSEALTLAKSSDFDIAILDINLGGDSIEPVAEVLDHRGLPFVFASGYAATGLPGRFRDRAVLRKPFLIMQLANAISVALGKNSPPGA